MSYEPRNFFLTPEDALYQLPQTLTDQLLGAAPPLTLFGFANQRIRCGEVLVEVAHRRVLRAVNLRCFTIPFDADGQINHQVLAHEALQHYRQLLDEAYERAGLPKRSALGNLIDASAQFDQRSRSWTPSCIQRQLMIDAALGKTALPRFRLTTGARNGEPCIIRI
jgi:hypothetical protein